MIPVALGTSRGVRRRAKLRNYIQDNLLRKTFHAKSAWPGDLSFMTFPVIRDGTSKRAWKWVEEPEGDAQLSGQFGGLRGAVSFRAPRSSDKGKIMVVHKMKNRSSPQFPNAPKPNSYGFGRAERRILY